MGPGLIISNDDHEMLYEFFRLQVSIKIPQSKFLYQMHIHALAWHSQSGKNLM